MRTEVLLLPGSVLLPSDTVLPPAEHPDTALEHNLYSPAAATASSGTLEARSSLGASGLRCWAREPVPPAGCRGWGSAVAIICYCSSLTARTGWEWGETVIDLFL